MRPRFSTALRLLLPCLVPFLLGMTASDAERFIAGCSYDEVTSICGVKLGDDFTAIRKTDMHWQDHDFKDTGVAEAAMHGFEFDRFGQIGKRGDDNNFVAFLEASGNIQAISLHLTSARVNERPAAYARERRLTCLLAGLPAEIVSLGFNHYVVRCGQCPIVFNGCGVVSWTGIHAKETGCKAEGSQFCSLSLHSPGLTEVHLFNPVLGEQFNEAMERHRTSLNQPD